MKKYSGLSNQEIIIENSAIIGKPVVSSITNEISFADEAARTFTGRAIVNLSQSLIEKTEAPLNRLKILRVKDFGSRLYQKAKPLLEKASGKLWELKNDFGYQYQEEGQAISILVPDGFQFDLASVPRFIWPFIAPFELSIAAPLIHDFLYAYKGNPPGETVQPQGKEFSRYQADLLFLKIMKEENIGKVKRGLAYGAVRIAGWIPWRSN